MTTSDQKGCLVTVTDERFMPGSIVMLSSFLRHNPWFAGDIVIINDGLSGPSRARLDRFPNVRLHAVGAALKTRLAALASARPQIAQKLPRLHSLEAFNLPGYDWVMKIDSDVLCTASAEVLTGIDGALLAIPDQTYFRDQVRHRQSYVPQHKALGSPDTVYAMTFNVGILMFRPGQLDPRIYDDLTEHVHPDTWSMVRTGHADSVVLNRHFCGSWTPVPESFNYVISRDAVGYKRPRIARSDAVFLHYIGRPKPWDLQDSPAPALDPERRLAFDQWNAAFSQITDR